MFRSRWKRDRDVRTKRKLKRRLKTTPREAGTARQRNRRSRTTRGEGYRISGWRSDAEAGPRVGTRDDRGITWRDGLDDELLKGGRTRRRLTRAQKRQERKNCWQKEGGAGGKPDLDFGAAEVCELRNTDESLAEIRQSLKDAWTSRICGEGLPHLSGTGAARKGGSVGEEETCSWSFPRNAEKQYRSWLTKLQ
eukprot:Em0006g1051a